MSEVQGLALALGLILAPVCAAATTLGASRGTILGGLLGVFLGSSLILAGSQQPRIAAGMLVAGAASVGILAGGFRRAGWPVEAIRRGSIPGGRAFRLTGIFLFGTAAWGLSVPFAEAMPSLLTTRVTAAFVVLAIGLLQLGLSQEQGSAGVGLLTALSGFELLYSGLEPSLAVRAVLAAIVLGIAAVTSILVDQAMEARPPDRRSG